MLNIEQLHEKILYPIVRVRTDKAGGSGTIIYSGLNPNNDEEYETYVLTNHHVIAENIKVEKKWDSVVKRKVDKEFTQPCTVEIFSYVYMSLRDSGQIFSAEIVAYDEAHDLALLKLDSPTKTKHVAKLYPKNKEKDIKLFTEVWCSGCSLGHEPLVNKGQMTSLKESIENKLYWMSNANSIFGNCLPGNVLVSMGDNSVKQIKDVETGDVVWTMGSDGINKRTVMEKINAGKKKVYKIKTRTRTIEASDNHPFLVVNSTKTWQNKKVNWLEWKQLKDIKEEDIIAVLPSLPDRSKGKNIRFADYIGNKDPKLLMKYLGFYVGNGWVRYEFGNKYEVSVATYNERKWEEYSNILYTLFELKPQMFSKNDVLTVSSKELVEMIKELGFEGRAIEKNIPTWILTQPREYQMAFIEGYLDADGHINKLGDWGFEANNENLITVLRMMFIHLGFNVSNVFERMRKVTVINGRETKANSPSYSFQVYPQYSKNKNTFIQGDINKLSEFLNYEKVSLIEEIGEEETFDLRIEKTHNFFANGVLVHNSGGAIFLAETGEFIGVPSRITGYQLGFGADIITWMGFFAPIVRVYDFFEEQELQFLYDSNYTSTECFEIRKKKMEKDSEHMNFHKEEEEEDGDEDKRKNKASEEVEKIIHFDSNKHFDLLDGIKKNI